MTRIFPLGEENFRCLPGPVVPAFLIALLIIPVCAAAADPLGSLIVESDPPSARVFINDLYVGATPFATKLDPGHYSVKLTKMGYQDYATTVAVFSDQVTTVTAALAPVPQTGTLSVTSTPSEARVLVDDVMVGMTPYTGSVSAGSHNVKVTKINYNDYSTMVAIAADQTTTLTVNLVPLQQTGSVSVFSTPAGASVYIDGIYHGTAPLTAGLAPASHVIIVSMAGYNDYIATVSLAAGQSLPVYVILVKGSPTAPVQTTSPAQATVASTPATPAAGGTGSLLLYSRPPGAKVYIEGAFMGTTPFGMRSVSAGTHQLLFTLAGYEDFATTITITAGQQQEFTATMASTGQGRTGAPEATRAPGFGLVSAIVGIAALAMIRRINRL